MPTTLGKKYNTSWEGRPAHMLGEDIPVWHKFRRDYGELFSALYYDVLLGGPFLSPAEEKDPMKRMWRATFSKRADAIAELKNEIWIIEVDKHPGPRAIGQLMMYRNLWLEDTPIEKPEKLVLIAGVVDTDLIASAARYSIETYIYPDKRQ